MTPSKDSTLRQIQAFLVLFLCMGTLLIGCSEAQPNTQDNSTASDSVGLPSGVSVKKVIKDTEINNNYRKRIELLTDGGKRVTITDPSGAIILSNIEYEGQIMEVFGNQVVVQVEQGEQQTITIPSHITIEDDEHLGLKKGVTIEWELDVNGSIDHVELDS